MRTPSSLLLAAAVAAAVTLLSGCQCPSPTAGAGRQAIAPPAAARRNLTPPLAARAALAAHKAIVPRFTDVARRAGLRFRWRIAGPRPLDILSGIGNGCAFVDYDNSGSLSALLVATDHIALFKGNGHGKFTDVSHAVGLDGLRGHFLGCAMGDYDNDGFADLYLSGYRTGLLLHNERGRRFRDVTIQAGLKSQPWGTSACFADVDGDGRLDLYVCNYVRYTPGTSPRLCGPNRLSCNPNVYPALRGIFYRSLGGGRFADATRTFGLDDQSGNGLGAAAADYLGTGHLSLYLANDETNGELFQNTGTGPLKNVGRASGTAADRFGRAHGGMGVDWGDYDNDGRLDLFVTTFESEYKTLYHNDGSGTFSDVSENNGIGLASLPYVAFGTKFLDADNDGWLDLLVANGHIADNVHKAEKKITFRQPMQLFRSVKGTAFADVSAEAGLKAIGSIMGRGLAVGDYDNDGREDALVVDAEGAPILLHNETPTPNHWLTVKLVGSGRSNRDAYGAMVYATLPDGAMRLRHCHADGSYLSSSDPRVHFGLGTVRVLKRLQVRWPDGAAQTWQNVSADRCVTLREGTGGQG